jgi:hypothetical protein
MGPISSLNNHELGWLVEQGESRFSCISCLACGNFLLQKLALVSVFREEEPETQTEYKARRFIIFTRIPLEGNFAGQTQKAVFCIFFFFASPYEEIRNINSVIRHSGTSLPLPVLH